MVEPSVKLNNLSVTRVTSLGITVPAAQPKLLIGAGLRDYQMEGLNWLKVCFHHYFNFNQDGLVLI